MNKQLLKINIHSLLMALSLIVGMGASQDLSAKSTVNDAFDPITFNIENVTGQVNDIVCVDVTVENFVRVETFQFGINYNSNLLQIVCPVDVTNSPLDQNELFFNCLNDDGTILTLWGDPNITEGDGVSVPDGDVIFTLCFRIIGDCGLSSAITILPHPIIIEVSQISEAGVNCENENVIINDGNVNIACGELTINESPCGESLTGNDGSISFFVAGGSGSYTYTVTPVGFTGTLGEIENAKIDGLTAGLYTISVTDNGTGLTISEESRVTDVPTFNVSLTATDPYCFNKDKGHIETSLTNSFGDPLDPSAASYEWSNFRFTDAIEDLGSGTYTVTVTDSDGCSTILSETLFVEPLILHAELIDSASCEGNDDAIVKIWAEGGTPFPPMPTNPEYEYETDADDDGPIDTLILNNVETGIFNFSVIDAAIPLCRVDSFIDIPFKGIDLSIELDTVDISCFGANDGSVMITAMGSTNFAFAVRDDMGTLIPGGVAQTQATFSNLTVGCYTVTVIEAFNGCEITGEFCIEEPAELVLMTDNVVNPGCVGNDGIISLSSTGGTEPYTYTWSDGPSMDEDRTGLVGGMYTVTVTDDNGCTDTAMFDLPDGADVQINANVIQAINCPQDQNGEIEVTISSGGTFTYNWELPDGTFISDMQTVSNLGSGVYYVTATDVSASCTALDTVILAAASPITIEGNFSPPTCPGASNGVISIVHIEGTAPFTYLWENQSSQQLLSGISEGTYNVTVTDANMCELDTFLTLTAPDPIIVNFTNLSGVDCYNTANGSVTAIASGGPEMTGTYTYYWSNDPSNGMSGMSSSQSNLTAGENWVIATDFFCLSDTMYFNIPDIDSIEIDLVSSSIISPSCFGDCDGSIDVMVTGGNPASYDLLWLDNNSNTSTRNNLCAGTYDLMITDANGCSVTRSIDLLNPELLTIKVDSMSVQPISCDGNNGQLTVVTTGGSDPFTFTWTDNVSVDQTASNLPPGTYNILVTDANNCTAVTAYTFTAPDPVTAVVADIEEPACFGDLTCIGIESASGGVGNNYKFSINYGELYPIDSCVAQYANVYDITVYDNSGCSWETSISIDQPDEIMIDAGPDQEIDLGNSSDVISPTFTSTLPADISWSPLDSLSCVDAFCEDVISNTLVDQLYTVTAVDENGCTASDDILITVNTSRNVYIANIFTPNGDGNNDYFNLVIGSGAVSVSFLSIFDRWGNRVFSIENEYVPELGQQDGWDGKHNGQYVNPGVYIYTAQVNFLDGRVLQYSGDITVIR